MKKFYLLAALALSYVEAVINVATIAGTAISGLTATTLNSNIGGSYTYSFLNDCIASTTLMVLGINNIYH